MKQMKKLLTSIASKLVLSFLATILTSAIYFTPDIPKLTQNVGLVFLGCLIVLFMYDGVNKLFNNVKKY